jgi:hypothetical protein
MLFPDVGSSGCRIGKLISLPNKYLRVAMLFAYPALFAWRQLIINKLLVDPSIQSLNRFTESIGKAEALSIEIANILQDAAQSSNGLIKKDITPWLPVKPIKIKPTRSKSASRGKVARKPSKGTASSATSGEGGSVKPPATVPPPPPLPVSPGLFSRYDREEIYEKVWKAPIEDVAKEYGITSDTLRVTCNRLWIPIPNRAYWVRKAAGQPVVCAPPLPKVQVQRKERATGTMPIVRGAP